MKRSFTAAQIAYPDQWNGAKRRRVASRLLKITPAVMERKKIQKVALDTCKRREARNADIKYTQDYTGQINVTRAGIVGDMFTNMTRGDSVLNNFDGGKVTPIGIEFNYHVDFTACIEETGVAYTGLRFIIFQENGPTVNENVNQYMNLTLSSATNILALKNRDYPEKNWRVLYDSGPITFCTTAGFSGQSGAIQSGQIMIPKYMLRPVYWGDDAGFPNKNALRYMVWSDSDLSPNPIFNAQIGVKFMDV